jgi:hypothetical protein
MLMEAIERTRRVCPEADGMDRLTANGDALGERRIDESTCRHDGRNIDIGMDTLI